jgi:UDP-N-acetylglucosamine diphosphorylase/glucosamine-1-phosphate N-acetyltransferase
MNLILFDDNRSAFLPFTYTRPVSEIRAGILTLTEKWEKYLNLKASYLTENYLSEKFPAKITEDNLLVNGTIFPNKELVKEIQNLKSGHKLVKEEIFIALRINGEMLQQLLSANIHPLKTDVLKVKSQYSFRTLSNIWDIFKDNGQNIEEDFQLLNLNRKSLMPFPGNTVIGNNLIIEEGAKINASVINTETGPVYIGKNAEIMEGCLIRGPFALCEESTLKMGAKIYGPTTVGPHSKVGGEVNNSVIFGYSNKAHDGFLGNSVIGEWCNLGADTNNSNLKNNYGNVKIWNCSTGKQTDTGLQFCGLFMADHSKCGINTMFNTGTVVGVSANIFDSGFPPKFIPSFSWGGKNSEKFELEKAIEVAQKVMERRNLEFTEYDRKIFEYLYSIK